MRLFLWFSNTVILVFIHCYFTRKTAWNSKYIIYEKKPWNRDNSAVFCIAISRKKSPKSKLHNLRKKSWNFVYICILTSNLKQHKNSYKFDDSLHCDFTRKIQNTEFREFMEKPWNFVWHLSFWQKIKELVKAMTKIS